MRRASRKRNATIGRYRGVLLRVALAGIVVAGGALVLLRPWGRGADPPAREIVAATPAPATLTRALTPPAPAPTPELARMSAAQAAAFDAWLIDAYKRCWAPPKTAPEGEAYLPRVRVAFKSDGALAATPRLVNPPYDPAWRAHADAALRAVKSCDPLHVPEKYAPYYAQWKTKTVFFDPARP